MTFKKNSAAKKSEQDESLFHIFFFINFSCSNELMIIFISGDFYFVNLQCGRHSTDFAKTWNWIFCVTSLETSFTIKTSWLETLTNWSTTFDVFEQRGHIWQVKMFFKKWKKEKTFLAIGAFFEKCKYFWTFCESENISGMCVSLLESKDKCGQFWKLRIFWQLVLSLKVCIFLGTEDILNASIFLAGGDLYF